MLKVEIKKNLKDKILKNYHKDYMTHFYKRWIKNRHNF